MPLRITSRLRIIITKLQRMPRMGITNQRFITHTWRMPTTCTPSIIRTKPQKRTRPPTRTPDNAFRSVIAIALRLAPHLPKIGSNL